MMLSKYVRCADEQKEFFESVERGWYELHSGLGTDAPYLLAGQRAVLKELYIDSGPVKYCIIYEVTEDYVGLVSLWHGVGSRKSDMLVRRWGTGR